MGRISAKGGPPFEATHRYVGHLQRSDPEGVANGSTGKGMGVLGKRVEFEGVRGEAMDPNHGGVVGVHHGGGIGTYGLEPVGVWGDDDDPNSTGVVGRGGLAGGFFNGSGPQSNALVLSNGGIRVMGAGGGTATPVFVQVVHDGLHGVPDNPCLVYRQATIIETPSPTTGPMRSSSSHRSTTATIRWS
jgi:hypothetical protein